jgi:hypothetical protein
MVLATVTGERTPTTPLVATSATGKVGVSVDPGVRRPAAACTTSFHEAWKKGLPRMSSSPHVYPATPSIRIAVPAWAWALALLALFSLYLIAQDNGAVLAQFGGTAHEFFHDARHSLGMPCH